MAMSSSSSPVQAVAPGDQTLTILIEGRDPIQCERGDTLLRAALRQGVGFPYECNSGGCGSCMFELTHGDVTELWPQAPGLTASARERGRLLACQCAPTSDCSVRVRTRLQYVAPVPPQRMLATVAGVKHLTHDMAMLCLVTKGAASFRPGQFAMLSLPGRGEIRAYSMCNIANDAGQWNFIIKRVPEGSFSNAILEASHGETIEVDGPYGVAYLKEDSPRDILCIAGGAGLSPMLSILRGAGASDALQSRELHFFYGGRAPRDICHEQMLAGDATLAGRVLHRSAISDDATLDVEWNGERGYIHEVVERHLGERIKDFEIYLSGPPPMTDAVQKMLVIKHRVPMQQIHFDRFY